MTFNDNRQNLYSDEAGVNAFCQLNAVPIPKKFEDDRDITLIRKHPRNISSHEQHCWSFEAIVFRIRIQIFTFEALQEGTGALFLDIDPTKSLVYTWAPTTAQLPVEWSLVAERVTWFTRTKRQCSLWRYFASEFGQSRIEPDSHVPKWIWLDERYQGCRFISFTCLLRCSR